MPGRERFNIYKLLSDMVCKYEVFKLVIICSKILPVQNNTKTIVYWLWKNSIYERCHEFLSIASLIKNKNNMMKKLRIHGFSQLGLI